MGQARLKPVTYSATAKQYAEDVLGGKVLACKFVKAAARRHLDDLENCEKFRYDPAAAERICMFAEAMPHTKGIWARRKEKIRLEPWQVFALCCIFGWVRKADGLRRFRTVYLEVARKNAKSTLLSVIALYLLACDGESGAEVYSAATTRDQARIVFAGAKRMAEMEPEFRTRFGVECWKDSVTVDGTGGSLKALSAEANTLDGLNPHGAIIDELHAHRTREVWDVMETATGARSQPLIAAITTAGGNQAGICYEIRGYVARILNTVLVRHDGLGYKIEGDTVTDDTVFGLIYTIDDDDEWQDERCWIKANPNLGVSVYLDDLQRQAKKAAHLASSQPNFLTKRMNVWVNADSTWMDMLAWTRCGADIEIEDYKGWPCVFGMDLASKTDFAALSMLFQRDGRYALFVRLWVPDAQIAESDNSQYAGWEINGHIVATDGNVLDHDRVKFEIKELADEYTPSAIAYDPGFDMVIPQALKNEGLPMVDVRATAQNFSEPMKQFEAVVLAGKIRHARNAAYDWMVSNVIAHENRGGQLYPTKERNDAKIDGPVSTFLAFAVGSKSEVSIWETRGAPI